jgi:DNA-directed RNA polymerase subunit F
MLISVMLVMLSVSTVHAFEQTFEIPVITHDVSIPYTWGIDGNMGAKHCQEQQRRYGWFVRCNIADFEYQLPNDIDVSAIKSARFVGESQSYPDFSDVHYYINKSCNISYSQECSHWNFAPDLTAPGKCIYYGTNSPYNDISGCRYPSTAREKRCDIYENGWYVGPTCFYGDYVCDGDFYSSATYDCDWDTDGSFRISDWFTPISIEVSSTYLKPGTNVISFTTAYQDMYPTIYDLNLEYTMDVECRDYTDCGNKQICGDDNKCHDVECVSDYDCSGNLRCGEDNKCHECVTNDDCGDRQICEAYNCHNVECVNDNDCPGKQLCGSNYTCYDALPSEKTFTVPIITSDTYIPGNWGIDGNTGATHCQTILRSYGWSVRCNIFDFGYQLPSNLNTSEITSAGFIGTGTAYPNSNNLYYYINKSCNVSYSQECSHINLAPDLVAPGTCKYYGTYSSHNDLSGCQYPPTAREKRCETYINGWYVGPTCVYSDYVCDGEYYNSTKYDCSWSRYGSTHVTMYDWPVPISIAVSNNELQPGINKISFSNAYTDLDLTIYELSLEYKMVVECASDSDCKEGYFCNPDDHYQCDQITSQLPDGINYTPISSPLGFIPKSGSGSNQDTDNTVTGLVIAGTAIVAGIVSTAVLSSITATNNPLKRRLLQISDSLNKSDKSIASLQDYLGINSSANNACYAEVEQTGSTGFLSKLKDNLAKFAAAKVGTLYANERFVSGFTEKISKLDPELLRIYGDDFLTKTKLIGAKEYIEPKILDWSGRTATDLDRLLLKGKNILAVVEKKDTLADVKDTEATIVRATDAAKSQLSKFFNRIMKYKDNYKFSDPNLNLNELKLKWNTEQITEINGQVTREYVNPSLLTKIYDKIKSIRLPKLSAEERATAETVERSALRSTERSVLRSAGRVLIVPAIAADVYYLDSAYKDDGNKFGKNTARATGEVAGGWAGAIAGAGAGALIGTAICPGIGTAVGGIIGGVVGGLGGSYIGATISQKLYDSRSAIEKSVNNAVKTINSGIDTTKKIVKKEIEKGKEIVNNSLQKLKTIVSNVTKSSDPPKSTPKTNTAPKSSAPVKTNVVTAVKETAKKVVETAKNIGNAVKSVFMRIFKK